MRRLLIIGQVSAFVQHFKSQKALSVRKIQTTGCCINAATYPNIGCGDVALRLVRCMRGRCRTYALSRSPQRFAALRAPGITPIRGDLDQPDTLDAIAGLAHDVVQFAPPPEHGAHDTRTAHLVAALAKGKSLPQRMVYLSTSGVYGDCHRELVAVARSVRPRTGRARRRADGRIDA